MLTKVNEGSGNCPETDWRGKVTPISAMRAMYAEGPRGVQSPPGGLKDPGRHRTSPAMSSSTPSNSDAETVVGMAIKERKNILPLSNWEELKFDNEGKLNLKI